MVVLATLVIVLAMVLGVSALVVLWPLAAVAAAVLYCLDRPARRTAWPATAALLAGVGIVFSLAVGHVDPDATVTTLVVLLPVVLYAAIIGLAGGPGRIKARHERAEAERRRVRAEASARRRRQRRESIRQRTGLDIDLLSDVTRDRAGRFTRAVGAGITRRLERRRPAPSGYPTAPDMLDLDQDVSAQLSSWQRDEIGRLAGQLDRER